MKWQVHLFNVLLIISFTNLNAQKGGVGIGTENPKGQFEVISASPFEEILDQALENGGNNITGTSRWQSFTAGVNGWLTRVDFNTRSTGTLDTEVSVTIYAGEGTGGPILACGTFITEGAFTWRTCPLDGLAQLEAGEVYTIQLSVNSVTQPWILVNVSNAYAGGRADYNPNDDLRFRTYMSPAIDSSSAISVWRGNVGIGKDDPVTKLDVDGVITSQGGNSDEWNAAFQWGDHNGIGYISDEVDPQIGLLTNNFTPVWNETELINGSIFDNGDIGIGTTTPNAKLGITQNSSLSDPHILLHENGNDYARLNFDNNNGSNYWSISAYIASNHRNDRLNFWNGTGGDVMTITGDGEVGIGVGISPKVPLHIGNGRRVLFGQDTLGAGDKLMFLPDLHAFRVGTVATGAASTYWNRDSIGLYSFASGFNTRAQGFGATAMGRDTEATNSYAFASGFFSNADGQYSTAMGFNTDAFALGSTALGYSTDAEANYSFAAGYFAEAQAIYSVAIGNAVQAQSYASMAVGRYNIGGGNATSWVSSDPIFEIGIGTGPSTRANAVTVRKNGNVGIGTTTPLDALQVNGRIRLATVEYFEDGGSSEITANGDIRPSSDNVYDLGTSTFRWDDVYATNGTINTSDERDKENIKEVSYGLNEIMQLNPVSFTWKENSNSGTKIGLLAQDLLQVIPEVVKTHDWQPEDESEDARLVEVELKSMGVYYSDLIPVLIKSIQEQQTIIDELRDRIKILEEK